jgi:hypothetical protein
MNVTLKSLEETKQMIDLLNGLAETGEAMRWAIVIKKAMP